MQCINTVISIDMGSIPDPVSRITYIVLMQTLNHGLSIYLSRYLTWSQ